MPPPDEDRPTLDCPACPRRDIPWGVPACPGCGADLLPLLRLHEFGDRCYNEGVALAARGRHEAAYAKLGLAVQYGCDLGQARLLLGKLAWQTGRRDLAVQHWRRALRAQPDLPEAERLLEIAARTQSWEGRRRLLTPVVFAVAGLVVGALGTSLLRAETPSETSPMPTLVRWRAAPKAALPPAGPSSTGSPVAALLEGHSEWRHKRRAGESVVWFPEGVFAAGDDVPSPGGERALQAVATTLSAAAAPLRVTVVGCTDRSAVRPGRDWPDNRALGFARAQFALTVLRRAAPSPGIRWLAATTGDRNPPYPNDTAANRARNRTVMLLIADDADSR